MPDPCQPIQQRIAESQDTKRALQEDLKDATPTQKAGIIKLIRQLDAEIVEQKKLLQECRETSPAPLRPDIGWELGSCLDPTTRGDVERLLTEMFARRSVASRMPPALRALSVLVSGHPARAARKGDATASSSSILPALVPQRSGCRSF